MCGIYTYFGQHKLDIKLHTDVIKHRGPDSDGFLTYDVENQKIDRISTSIDSEHTKVCMGFRRLAIIDLADESNQPFSHENGLLHIVFNGEIYNYLELRKDLMQEGVNFKTNSDTEVLLKSYEHWGTTCFNKFNGMWSCCILDLRTNELIICRDRFGIKPLFYHIDDKGISFVSELKQLFKSPWYKKEINEEVIKDLLESAVLDASEETFFKDVYRFPAGSYCKFPISHIPKKLNHEKYWSLSMTENKSIKYLDAVENFKEIFQSSIDLRFRSDVPVGACLSGGLDSSSIVSFAGFMNKSINTFTIDNTDPNLSEIQFVNEVVNRYQGLTSVVDFNQDNDLDYIPRMLEIQDEPFSQLGIVAQWRVMQLAAKNGVTVLLDGQGGDEIFGGYRKFIFFYLKELVKKGHMAKAVVEAAKFLNATELKIFEIEGVKRYLNMTHVNEYFSPLLQNKVKKHNISISGASGFQQKSYEDIIKYSYPQLLRYEDRNSMAFSLESRVPFLDYRLVEFVFNLPSSYKIRNGFTKAILRDSMKGILPDLVRLRKSKMGFATPEKIWFTDTHRKYFLNYFKEMNNPYLNNLKLFNEISNNKNRLDYKTLLRIYLFDRWYVHHFH